MWQWRWKRCTPRRRTVRRGSEGEAGDGRHGGEGRRERGGAHETCAGARGVGGAGRWSRGVGARTLAELLVIVQLLKEALP